MRTVKPWHSDGQTRFAGAVESLEAKNVPGDYADTKPMRTFDQAYKNT
jgi:hypothetical protein